MHSLLPDTSWTPYTFIATLVAFTTVFCFHLERRKYFWLRALGTVGALCLAAFLWSLGPGEIWDEILEYITYYVLLLVGAYLCFNIKGLGASFIATAGYAAQHFTYKLSQLVFTFLLTVIEGFEDRVNTMRLIYGCIIVAALLAFYFLFGRRIKKGQANLLENRINILISAVLLTMVSVLSAIFEDRCDPLQQTLLYGAGSAYDMVACVATIMYLFKVIQQKQRDADYEKAEALWKREKEMLQTSKENMEYLRILAHDLKHEVEGALASGHQSKRLKELGKSLDNFGKTLVTGNDALDIVLAERKTRMDKEGIEFTCIADGKALDFMSSSDVYSLFVNLIDNAVNAMSKVTKKQRRISLSVQKKMGLVFIHEENPCFEKIEFDEDGKPKTTDKDKDNHGLGTKSIELVANRYGGHATFQQKDETFSVDIVLDPAYVRKND